MADAARPQDLLDHPMPDVVLPGSDDRDFAFRGTGRPTVLFFYLRNASPG